MLLRELLELFSPKTHLLIENEEKQALLNDRIEGVFTRQRMPILQRATVLQVIPFETATLGRGLKIMVGHHES
jgi:hypothetical protein